MQKTKRLPILLSIFLVLSLISFPVSAQLSDTQQKAAKSILTLSSATSVQFALIEGDEITLSGNAGVYSKLSNTPLDSGHIYGIGSVSKMYTTVAVMKLVETGKISLDAPVTKYLPAFTMADARYQQITVRMLLNHSSGLMGSSVSNGFLFQDTSSYAKDALLTRLKTQTLKANPGAYSVYCNDGFTLAELIIEAVSGKSYTEYIHEIITGPLGLSRTFTPKDSFDTSLLAKIYYPGNVNPLPRETLNIIGTGGIYASAEDLARFGSLFYNNSALTQLSQDAMASPEYRSGIWPKDEDQGISYGLGWDNVELRPFQQAGIQALVKGGDTLNYHASLIVLPEHRMAVAVLSSGGASPYNQLLGERLLIDVLKQKGIHISEDLPVLPRAKPAPMPESELSKAGLYGATGLSIEVKLSQNGQMTMDILPGITLTYHSDGSFRDAAGTMLFRLVEETDGNIYLFQKAYSQIPGFPPMVTANYVAQLLPKKTVSDEAWAAWEAVSNIKFLILNERPSSQVYLLSPMVSFHIVRNEYGYVNGSAVVSASSILPCVTVPGVGSRDYQPLTLKHSGGKTYLQANDFLTISEASVSPVFTGSAVCTTQADGYARWYKVGSAVGKQLTVTRPGGGQFYVYDANGLVIASSLLGDTGCASLPADGYLVFLAAPGQQFTLSIT